MSVAAGAGRIIEAALAGAALLLMSPVLVVIAAWLAIDGSGSVLYVETRVGRGGHPFRVHKFRTLRVGSPTEPGVAVRGDPRITRPGRWLRHWRLDELPQLADVLVGTMSLVGPRPQTAANLSALDPATRDRLLSVRPGLTSRASLAHLGEDDILGEFADPVGCYRAILVPAKVRLELEDIERSSWSRDVRVLVATVVRCLSPVARRRSRERMRSLLVAGGCRLR